MLNLHIFIAITKCISVLYLYRKGKCESHARFRALGECPLEGHLS